MKVDRSRTTEDTEDTEQRVFANHRTVSPTPTTAAPLTVLHFALCTLQVVSLLVSVY